MIIKKLISKNFTCGGINPEGLIVHSTANPGATALNHYILWNRDNTNASAHYINDWNGCLQLIEESNRAWHAGATANKRFLGWEICEPPKGDTDKLNRTYWNAVKGIAEVLKARGWNTKDNLWTHAWASNTFHETDHQDPYPFFKEYGISWDKFYTDIDNAMSGSNETEKKYYVVSNYLPDGYKGDGTFEGIDLEYVLSYFEGIRCYIKSNDKGLWIETQYLPLEKCQELKETLGSWFWSIEEV